MNKTILILLFAVSFAAFNKNECDAQSNLSNILSLPEGRVLQSLSSYGYSKIYNTACNIGSVNPASLKNFTSVSAGISYQLESDITEDKYLVEMYRHSGFTPQSIGIVYPMGDWRFAVSFSQKYNLVYRLNFDLDNDTAKTTIYSYSISTTYNVSPEITLGLNLGYNKMESFYSVGGFHESNSFNRQAVSWAAGALYKNAFSTLDYNLGVFYEKGMELKGTSYGDMPYIKNEGKLNDRLNFSGVLSTSKAVKLSADFTLLFPVEGKNPERYGNESSLDIICKTSEIYSGSFGFIYLNNEYDYEDYYQALFFSAGGNIKLFNNFILDIACAFTPFTYNMRQQAICKVGVLYSLNSSPLDNLYK